MLGDDGADADPLDDVDPRFRTQRGGDHLGQALPERPQVLRLAGQHAAVLEIEDPDGGDARRGRLLRGGRRGDDDERACERTNAATTHQRLTRPKRVVSATSHPRNPLSTPSETTTLPKRARTVGTQVTVEPGMLAEPPIPAM